MSGNLTDTLQKTPWPVPCKAWAFVCLLLYSCSAGPTDAEIMAFAQVRCEAVTLKNERFALADSIRILEEKIPAPVQDIEKMQQQGEILKTKSLVLADTIQTRLNYLFTKRFTTSEEKNHFLEMVENKMLEMHCK